MTGLWFSPGTPVSSTNKAGRHDITETLLKVALNTIISPFCNGKKVSFEDFNLLVFYYLSASEIWLDIGVAFGLFIGGGLWSLCGRGPRRSLRYATHRLMVMHPHTKYN